VVLTCAVSLVWTLRRRRIPNEQHLFYGLLMLAFVVENTAAYIYVYGNGNNGWLYSIYLPLDFILLATMAALHLRRTWSTTLAIAGGVGFFSVLVWEIFGQHEESIIFALSTTLSFCLLTALFAGLLIDLVERTTTVLWKDQRFWVYLSVFIFTGPAIPFVGLLNKIYKRDPDLAVELFIIIDVLFFLRYGAALIGGWLLKPRHQTLV